MAEDYDSFKQRRNDDPITSHLASFDLGGHRMSQKDRLLAVYDSPPGWLGLTWCEAGEIAGIKNCWRRISELLRDGYLQVHVGGDGLVSMRPGTEGRLERVLVLADREPPARPVESLRLF